MDYDGALSYLKGFERLGYRFRLENTRELLDKLGFEYGGDVIHISGTNGKGSCAAALGGILLEAGRRVGLYTSPELIDFTERMRVNGRQIGRREFGKYAGRLKPLIGMMADKPTFFEATTALALKYFADSGVDAMVLEVGMGGRLDSTNALPSRLAVITNVDLDHTQYLGATVEEIAKEKAGIVREGSTLITAAEGAPAKVLKEECRKKGAGIIQVGSDVIISDVRASIDGISFTLKTGKGTYLLSTPMRGAHQAENIACAVAAAEKLGVGKKAITAGVSKAYWPGRLDVVQRHPAVILDCAHNPAGIRSCMGYVKAMPHKRLVVVAGFSKDKDYKRMIEALSEADVYIATEYKGERSLKTEEILRHVKGIAVKDARKAVKKALSVAKKDDLILVTGSIYVVGEAIRNWKRRIDV